VTSKRKVFRELRSLEDALSTITKSWTKSPLPTEKVALEVALDRVLAEDVYSAIDVPGFDRAAMDGFALCAEDTFNVDEQHPVRLKVLGELDAGDTSSYEASRGQAIEIATGAPMPKGANAVVMVEFTKRESDEVAVFRPASPGENVTGAGSDVMSGELLLRKFQIITPREVGILAAAGVDQVSVFRNPRVTIFSSGNELIKPGQPLTFAKLYDVNGPAITAAVMECGGQPKFMGILPDNFETIKSRLKSALEESDIVISSGSTSSGPGDLVYRAVDELGEPGVLVHGLTIKPGKPALVGLAGNKLIFGLPGYPTSALMIFHVLVAPIIRKLANRSDTQPTKVRAVSSMKFFKARGRRELLPIQLIARPNGQLAAYPMQGGSGAISSFALADGFADFPEAQEYVDEGEGMEVELFGKELMPPSLVAIGSHCVGLDVAFAKLREKDPAFLGRTVNVGSTGGFHAISRGEADIAGVHLQDEETGEYNVPFIKSFGLADSVVLVRGYNREQGLIVKHGNPKKITDVEGLTRKSVRFINRNRGSGTRFLIDRHLNKVAENAGTNLEAISARIEGYGYEAKSHSAVAAAIKNDRADVGFGIRTVAVANGLDFIKLDDEKYDLLIERSRLDKVSVQRFIELIKSRDFAVSLEQKAPGLRATDQSGLIIYPSKS
jgi:putative molybdopterin biosynthesis protein